MKGLYKSVVEAEAALVSKDALIARLRERIEKLEGCVKAARKEINFEINEFTEKGWIYPARVQRLIAKLTAVRAALGGVITTTIPDGDGQWRRESAGVLKITSEVKRGNLD